MTEALETKQLSFPFSITGDSHTLAGDSSSVSPANIRKTTVVILKK